MGNVSAGSYGAYSDAVSTGASGVIVGGFCWTEGACCLVDIVALDAVDSVEAESRKKTTNAESDYLINVLQ